ncbi:hypothetical protein ACQ4LE_007566 [Meloidogyne hapla]|uniref:COMM domain-containing protein n=1 Tax=Meloidogyne hapla TaxID=6305 RepID=A0A1I8BS21_MELHA
MTNNEKGEPRDTIPDSKAITKNDNSQSAQPETLFCEYKDCQFRFDINVSSSQKQVQSGDHEILMEFTTKDGQRRVFSLDVHALAFLREQLEKVEQAFPRCYVYKK